jgi:hypothetical protein
MSSSGMLRHVALVRTVVSEEPSASIIRVTTIGKLGATLAVIKNRSKLRIMEKLLSYETSVPTRATRSNIPEDGILHSHHRENLKSYKTDFVTYHLMKEYGVTESRLCQFLIV